MKLCVVSSSYPIPKSLKISISVSQSRITNSTKIYFQDVPFSDCVSMKMLSYDFLCNVIAHVPFAGNLFSSSFYTWQESPIVKSRPIWKLNKLTNFQGIVIKYTSG